MAHYLGTFLNACTRNSTFDKFLFNIFLTFEGHSATLSSHLRNLSVRCQCISRGSNCKLGALQLENCILQSGSYQGVPGSPSVLTLKQCRFISIFINPPLRSEMCYSCSRNHTDLLSLSKCLQWQIYLFTLKVMLGITARSVRRKSHSQLTVFEHNFTCSCFLFSHLSCKSRSR